MSPEGTALTRPVEILLVEDSEGDARLTLESMKDAKVANNLTRVKDGVEAMDYLLRQGQYQDATRPDLVLLDLNMPRMDGREVLEKIRAEPSLTRLPVVILTTSDSDQDVLKAYDLHANCFVTKPVGLEEFMKVVQSIENFWLTVVQLPPGGD